MPNPLTKLLIDGIMPNLVSDIVKYLVSHYGDGTRAEKALKAIGFIEADLDDEIQKCLQNSFVVLQVEQPELHTGTIEKVMLEPAITRHIASTLRLGQIPKVKDITTSLNKILLHEPDLRQQFKAQKININELVKDFLKAFRIELAQYQTADGILVRWKIEEEHQQTRKEFHERFDQLQSQQPQKSVMRCPKPPDEPEKFGGRDQYYTDVMARLKAGETNAITAAQGVGGIGKTTLARKVAYDAYYTEKYFKAVVWTEVNQHPDLYRLLAQWGNYGEKDYYPAPNTPIESVMQQVKELLQAAIDNACPNGISERVLLVLDDVWADGVKVAQTLLKIKPRNCTVLITSRSSKVALGLVDKSNIVKLPYLAPADGAKMLREWLIDADENDLQALSTALGGHPLALKLAALRVLDEEDRSGANRADTLKICIKAYEVGLLEHHPFADLEFEQEADDKDANLTTSIALSYEALPTDDDRARFRALGILPLDAPFDVDLLAALWDMDSAKIEKYCDSLRRLALLDTTENKDWYKQHRLLKAYAYALLTEKGENDTIFRRYAQHITKVAYFFPDKYNKPEEWGVMTPYLPHIHEVGDTLVKCYASNPIAWVEITQEFAHNTFKYLERRPEALFEVVNGEPQPLRLKWLEIGLASSRQQKRRIREGLFLNGMGYIERILGNSSNALTYWSQALEIWYEQNHLLEIATTLTNIGEVFRLQGKYQEALYYYQQALPIRQQVGDKLGEAITLNNIGRVFITLSDYSQARDKYEQALHISQQIGDKLHEAKILNNIGRVYNTLGDYSQALDKYEQALPISRQVGDKLQEATILTNIGGIYHALGDYSQALDKYEQALPISRQVGDKLQEATTLNNIGALYQSQGDYVQALMVYEQTLPIRQQVGDKSGEVTTLNNMATIYFHGGQLEKAVNIFNQIIEIVRVMDTVADEALYRANKAAVLQKIGRVVEAVVEIEQAIFLLKSKSLSRSASSATLEQYEAFLVKLKRESSP
jgi:tetratricopeptide (TPR) repeat protein